MKELYVFSIEDSGYRKLQFCEDRTLIEAFAEQNLDEMLPLKEEVNWVSIGKINKLNSVIEKFQALDYPKLHFAIIASHDEAVVTKIKRDVWRAHCQYIQKNLPIDYFYGYI